MRLLELDPEGYPQFSKRFPDNDIPPYAILSHTWGKDDDEVIFDDICEQSAKEKPGYKKIRSFGRQASKDDFRYFWVDTCCIDKSNSTELSRAIISMFRWYSDAAKCYVYLSDVSVHDHDHDSPAERPWEVAFRKSKWFTRGWTLQELVAPKLVEFFSQEWVYLGDKITLERPIHETTQIPVAALRNVPLSTFSVDERLRWAETRHTKEEVDKWYCLQGIFNVYMVPMYGETHENAFRRLQEKLDKLPEAWLPQARTAIENYYMDANRLLIQRLSGGRLPMDRCYINLALVERSTWENRAPGSSSLSRVTQPKIDAAVQDSQVSLLELFRERKDSNGRLFIPKRILIRGLAGVGKTTLCKKIVYDFLHHQMWQPLFDYVLWIPLRHLKSKSGNAYSLQDLFEGEFFPQHRNRENVSKALCAFTDNERTRSKVLFILDGLDEVAQEWNLEAPMNKFLRGLLQQPQVIVTSRPHGTNLDIMGQFDLYLETTGFQPNEIEAYVNHPDIVQGGSDGTIAPEILTFIRGHPLIQGLVQIPIQLDALCYSWDQNFHRSDVPKSMTAIYQAIALKLWQKDICRLEKSRRGRPLTEYEVKSFRSWRQIEGATREEMLFLECLAFTGLCNEVIEFTWEDRDQVYEHLSDKAADLLHDELMQKVSFVRSSDTSLADHEQSYHFIHLTFQEFFAAQYFVRHWVKHTPILYPTLRGRGLPPITPREFFQKEKYNPQYNMLWRFVAGLFQACWATSQLTHLEEYLQAWDSEPQDLLGPVHQQLLIHCYSEVTASSDLICELRERRQKELLQWVLFESKSGFGCNLGREREFPEHFLKTILQTHSEKAQLYALDALSSRPSVSVATLEFVARWLNDSTSLELQRSSIKVIASNIDSCPDDISDKLVECLKDEDLSVKYYTAEALGKQSSLPQSILDTLVSYLKDEDSFVQYYTAEALGKQSSLPQSILDTLVSCLKDEDLSVRLYTAEALGKQSSLPQLILDTLVSCLKDEDSSVRSSVVKALGKQSSLPQSILDTLISCLKDEDLSVRLYTAEALGKQSSLPQSILDTLILYLKDEDLSVRSSAAKALGKQSSLPQSILDTLVSYLKDKDSSVRLYTAEALGKQLSLLQSILDTLVSCLKDEDSFVKYYTAEALGKQSSLPQSILDTLVSCLKDEDSSVRSSVAKALGKQSSLPQSILDTLVLYLKDEDSLVRYYIAGALGKQSSLPQSTLDTLVSCLKDKELSVRSSAAEALGKQSSFPQSILDTLILYLKDEKSSVRSSTAKALGKQSSLPQSILDTLILYLKDEKSSVRSSAAKALGKQSSLPQSILDTLVSCLKDKESSVRSSAAEALGKQSSFPQSTFDAMVSCLDHSTTYLEVEQVLRNRSEFYSLLPTLQGNKLQGLLNCWLKRSFHEHLCCYKWNGKLYIQMPEGLKEVNFETPAQGESFFLEMKNMVREATKSKTTLSEPIPQGRKRRFSHTSSESDYRTDK